MNESPDTAKGPNDTELHWADPNAVTFGFIGDNCVVAKNSNHPEMLKTIRFALAHGPVGASLVLRQEGIRSSRKFSQAEDDAFEDAVASTKRMASADRVRAVMAPCGRYWPEDHLLSFWSKKSDVPAEKLNLVVKMVDADKKLTRIEFSDDEQLPYEKKPMYKDLGDVNESSFKDFARRTAWDKPCQAFCEGARGGRRFWGKDAAGIIVKRPDGKILMLKRSGSVMGGGWGVPGGRIDHGQTALSTVKSEAEEEMGGLPDGSFSGRKYVFKLPLLPGDSYVADDMGNTVQIEEDDEEEFTYTTLEYVTTEEDWEPELNWEHDDFAWLEPREALKLGSVTQRDANGKTIWPVRQMISSLYGGGHAV